MSIADTPVRNRGEARRLRGTRLLLAEDTPDHRTMFAAMLRLEGAEVELADNGRRAVQRVLETDHLGRPFDLVILDMQMPVLDGYSAASTLCRAGHDGEILALTAHAMNGQREKCLEAGCTAYATKPIRNHQLIDTVDNLVHRPTSRRREAAFPAA